MEDSSTSDWCDIIIESNITNESSMPFCVLIETYAIDFSGTVQLRINDLIILIFNVTFLGFLVLKLKPTIEKLIGSWAKWPLFTILYFEILCIPIFCCVHEIISIPLSHAELAVKISHYVLRGSILITEISVVVFGLTFKKYQGRKRTLFITMVIILLLCIGFVTLEGILDTLYNHHLACDHHKLFTHGGMIFSFITSTILSLAYLTTFLFYSCNLHTHWNLPSKKSFYRYALFLSIINVVQAVGSMLWYEGLKHQDMGDAGICMTLFTTDVYLITFAPVAYWIFLRNYFRMNTDSSHSNNISTNTTPPNRKQWWKVSLSNISPRRPNSKPLPIYKQILRDESTQLLHDESVSSVGSYISIGMASPQNS